MLDEQKPNADLQHAAFDARVISVLEKEKKKARKRLLANVIYIVGGSLVGYAYAALSSPLIQ